MIFARRDKYTPMKLFFSPLRRGLPRFAAPLVLLAAFYPAGCSRNQPPPLSQTAGPTSPNSTGIPPLTEQKLDPLTASDVEMYLSVMRAAAARVQNPTADDKATLAQAEQIVKAADAGHVPNSSDARTLERASEIGTEMDQIVAEDRHMDAAAYLGVALAVEAVVPNPQIVATEKKMQEDAGSPQSPLDRRIAAVNAANRIFLTPYRDEIERLLAIVRNPANLPKS
jgi:hypothetical protein